ncbi:hypothetical protein FV222_10410 [Methylobacterium sp. WL103]|uniref:hypothetical protein n=1 Tax=unclassified Methylobacterium TaxID=2615210 RepID=UPI0011CCBE67|nr:MULTISPECIES: hypothetical protein [unclassified Methylobacterium]TXM64985.1 hypothetical protein FV226_25710 [Methylobacterium sp. WL12]TXN01621.1 hypothetical protein FV222_10410 [Methylobacterium sp. WL103]
MLTFASLLREVEANAPAREAMSLLDTALARRTSDEQGAFWRAIDIYYVSRKAPGAEAKPEPPALVAATQAP